MVGVDSRVGGAFSSERWEELEKGQVLFQNLGKSLQNL